MTTESGYDDKAYDARMEELYDLPLSFSLLLVRWRPIVQFSMLYGYAAPKKGESSFQNGPNHATLSTRWA